MRLELWVNTQKGEGKSGKAPPVWGAKESRDIEGIEEAGSNGAGNRNLNKEERWRRCRDIWEKGRQHREA